MKPIPRQPHPDVAIVRHELEQLSLGQTVPYAAVAKSIGVTEDDPVFYRRATAARKQLRREGIIVECGDKCFVRLDSVGILTRHQGRERKGLHRKARHAMDRLAAVDLSTLDGDQKSNYFAEATITRIIEKSTATRSVEKFLAATKVSQATLPMAKALEVLRNGDK